MIVLPSHRPPDRFYRGGAKIVAFRSEEPGTDRQPEDWVASTTPLFGETKLGVTVLPDGRPLDQAVTEDPRHWLGAAHVDRFGVDTMLLVKLLDAGQRLPVHAHPPGAFAGEHLGLAHGKAEAWYILDGGVVHLGLTRDVTTEELAAMVAAQDVDALLGLLHPIDVQPGDIVYVPPGMLHAIGAGVFLVEVQEPADLSILLEWRDFELDGERDGHLGLGFPLALRAVERQARSASEMQGLVRPAGFGPSVLPPEADPYFRLEHVLISGTTENTVVEPGFAVLVGLDGSVVVSGQVVSGQVVSGQVVSGKTGRDGTEVGSGVHLPAGGTVLAAHGDGPLIISGTGEVLICRPPRAV